MTHQRAQNGRSYRTQASGTAVTGATLMPNGFSVLPKRIRAGLSTAPQFCDGSSYPPAQTFVSLAATWSGNSANHSFHQIRSLWAAYGFEAAPV